MLSHLNSVWNPFLYAWGMSDFRLAMRKLLRLRRRDPRRNGNLNLQFAERSQDDHNTQVVVPFTPRMNKRQNNGTAASLISASATTPT